MFDSWCSMRFPVTGARSAKGHGLANELVSTWLRAQILIFHTTPPPILWVQLSLPFNLVVQDWEVSMSANCCQKLLSIANFMSFQHISAVTKIWKIYMSAMNCWQKPLPVTNCHPILAVVETGEVSMSPNYSQKVLPIGFEPWDPIPGNPIPCGRKKEACPKCKWRARRARSWSGKNAGKRFTMPAMATPPMA
jgi:hypothetical protein